jgi:hypothetical protein
MQNMIRKRVRPCDALLPSDGRWMIASSDGLVDRSAENSGGVQLTAEAIGERPRCRVGDRERAQSLSSAPLQSIFPCESRPTPVG